ncbi:Hypothetical predicted protein [Octopus vulgaris]|uniref:Uncharacterized protein n=1 Tax=Octopus vulgaris TaxID=6645 RepID=A0AA36F8Z5_OCTVU|nr:Hypothetical predicted protein [Octopus vulgaris]
MKKNYENVRLSRYFSFCNHTMSDIKPSEHLVPTFSTGVGDSAQAVLIVLEMKLSKDLVVPIFSPRAGNSTPGCCSCTGGNKQTLGREDICDCSMQY